MINEFSMKCLSISKTQLLESYQKSNIAHFDIKHFFNCKRVKDNFSNKYY